MFNPDTDIIGLQTPHAGRRSGPRRRDRAAVAVLAAAWLATTARAEDVPREYVVKAAFLYNFTQFVEWPASAFPNNNAPFVIGVIGNPRFAAVLENAMAGKSAGTRVIVVRPIAAVAESTGCQVVFVSESHDAVAAALVERTGRLPVLTVGESDAFADCGGGIRLFTEDRKMRFELNIKSTTEAGLKVSGKLQQLARSRRS